MCLEMTVLKPCRGDQRRWVYELALPRPSDRFSWVAFAFQSRIDTLLDALFRCFGIVDDLLLLSDLTLEFFNVFPNPQLLFLIGSRQLTLCVFQAILESLELPVQ